MIYFLSDAHVGSRALSNRVEHEKVIADLLTELGKDATAIYLLGDMFDYWYEYVWDRIPKLQSSKVTEFQRVLETLRGLTERGVEVHYLVGNHDMWTFGYLAKRTGVIVHKQPITVEINGKRCFLAHGDGLGCEDRGARWLFRFFRNPVCQQLFRLMPPALGDAIGYEWAKRSRLKELQQPCPYKGENEEELVRFAKSAHFNAEIDYFIFGHRHIELDLELANGARVICLGDLFKLMTYAAMDEAGGICFRGVESET